MMGSDSTAMVKRIATRVWAVDRSIHQASFIIPAIAPGKIQERMS